MFLHFCELYTFTPLHLYTINSCIQHTMQANWNKFAWNKTNTTYALLAKPAKAFLWYPLSDLFFETVERVQFIYFYGNNFPNFGAHTVFTEGIVNSWFFLKLYTCFACVKISVTVLWDYPDFICKTLWLFLSWTETDLSPSRSSS